MRNIDVRDRRYRIANYIGFRPGKATLTNANAAGSALLNGDQFMTCGWPLHLAHDPDGTWATLASRMRTYGQVLPLEIGLMNPTDVAASTTARVGNHPTFFGLDMEVPPNNPHYSDNIPVPRFSDVGLGEDRSMAQIKMRRVTTTIEFGVQPFSLNLQPFIAESEQEHGTANNAYDQVNGTSAYQFTDAAITRNWSDEVRIVQLLVHSDGEICDFDFTQRNNASTVASRRWHAERFFDFENHPLTTLYGDAGARLDFYAPVTGRYKALANDNGCSEAFWKVDVLHDQVYAVASTPTFIDHKALLVGRDGDAGMYGASITAEGAERPFGASLQNADGTVLGNNGAITGSIGYLDAMGWARPIVPAGKSDLVVIDYPLDAGLYYTQQTINQTTVEDVVTPQIQAYHCENAQVITFIFSKNSISRPVATRGRGIITNGVQGNEAPNSLNHTSAISNWCRGDTGTVAAFFCGKIVKEFEVPDKV